MKYSLTKFTLTMRGRSPLLMHQDNLEHQDEMKEWIADPDNKKKSVPGDDRTPGFTWLGALYQENGLVVLMSEMLTKCLINAGAKLIKKGNTSYKSSIASAVFLDEAAYPLLVGGKEVQMKATLDKLKGEMNYVRHCQEVAKHGFKLFAKRSTVGNKKHVRVRPLFKEWACVVTGEVDTDELPKEVFERITEIAGKRVGVGDWRPSSKISPGTYGTFATELKFGK